MQQPEKCKINKNSICLYPIEECDKCPNNTGGEKMKIVIDIPEKIYNRYINYTESYIDFVFVGTEEILVKAIRNGTPLPKGHGALKDASELLNINLNWED